MNNWKQDLICTLNHSNLILLETQVPNNSSDSYEQIEHESGYDQATNGVSTRPSAAYIEKFLDEQGVTFKRYDDEDLNAHPHVYNWEVGGSFGNKATRRFWILKND